MQGTSPLVVVSYRDLIFAWTMRTIQARYKQSLLGGLWAIIQPAARAIVFTIVFSLFIPIDTGDIPYIVFSYTAMLPWALFSASLTDMASSLVINMSLVSKIYFPREILPVSALLARLVDFAVASGILVALIIYYQMPIYPIGWLFLPVILFVQLTFTIGLGLMGAALNVFYRDVQHLVVFALQLWLYATPIIYPVDKVPEWLLPFYFLNPMSGIIEAFRAVLFYQQTPDYTLGIAATISVILAIVGYWFFKRVEPQFADVV